MFSSARSLRRPTTTRARCVWLTAVAVIASMGLMAGSASATTHDYCFWDGSYSANAANVKCFQSGDNYLTNNYAWLVYAPTLPTIYCGAHQGGAQYGSFTSGNPSCSHAYGGANLLKAAEYVDIAATTHGTITY